MGVPVKEGEVTAGDIKTSYLEAGTGPELVLIHGSGGGAVNWYKVIGPLSEHFHLYAPDVVGFGESDKPDAPYDGPYLARWLLNFLDALELPRVNMVGESFGGAIALHFTHANPARVEKLVLVDAGAVGGWDSGISLLDTASMMFDHIMPTRGRVERNLRKIAVTESEEVEEPLIDYFHGVLQSDGAHNWFWQGRGNAIKAMPKEDLATIDTATLLLWGEDDELFPLGFAQDAEAIFPDAQLRVIAECKHTPHLDRPLEMVAEVLRFLEEGFDDTGNQA